MTGQSEVAAGAATQAAFAAAVVDEWVRAGVSHAVIAPGSRSTPLVAALAVDGRIAIHVVLDERSAGFTALGIGLASGSPAVAVTTSGTAAVELHPAVVEAHQAGVPLLAVTADRPPELHHVGAPQTVDQGGLYGSAPRWQVSPGVPDAAARWSWRPLASRSVAEATCGPRGPGAVHLNLAFREPLLAEPGELPDGRADGAPWHQAGRPAARAPDVEVIERLLARDVRGLIVAGAGAGDPAAVAAAANALGWPVLADPRSGCRVPGPAVVVAAADAILRVPVIAGGPDWRPDVVVRLGSPWASKVLGEWLAGLGQGLHQVLVDPYGRWADPGRQVSEVIVADPTEVCLALAASPTSEPKREWQQQWATAEELAQGAITSSLSAAGGDASEPAIARAVVAAVPDGGTLMVSSSMPVRDVEWYGAPRAGLRVLANRGANGIDGVVSTTLGVALAGASPTVGLVGDLAFFYDAGALLWAAERELDCTFVVVDNDGGGIFSFLPQATQMPPERFKRLWTTPHRGNPGALAAAYGVVADRVGSASQVAEVVRVGGKGVRVVVVKSEGADNVAWHDRIHAAVAAALGERFRA